MDLGHLARVRVMLGSGQINEPRQEMRKDLGIEMIMNAYWNFEQSKHFFGGLYYSGTQ